MKDKNLIIFIDESGNFDFSKNGTNYFVLTAISTLDPITLREDMHTYKYELLANGINNEYFHATEDRQEVRDQFYNLINKLDDFSIDSVVVEKNKTHPSLYVEKKFIKNKIVKKNNYSEFYRLVCQTLLKYIFKRYNDNIHVENIIIILDNLFTNDKREYVLKALKTYLKMFCTKPFYIYFHQNKSDINCQITDYCGWAIYVKNERNELRPSKEIQKKIKSEFDIFKTGSTKYY